MYEIVEVIAMHDIGSVIYIEKNNRPFWHW